jgi:hypothetical protein
MAIGRFANMARTLLALMPLKARLWVISWIARNRLWFAVPPMAYARKIKRGERGLVDRSV